MPAVPFSDAQPPLILALDLGSSSLRAVLFDAQARLIEGHIASQPHAFRTATDGAAEDDAKAVFEGVVQMIDGILNQIGRRSGEVGGVAVLDDYGHHPTAIRATLEAARQRYPGRRLWAVYEPLTYHRTAAMLEAFADALALADRVAVADIWSGRDPDTTVTSPAALADAVNRRRPTIASATGSVEETAGSLAEWVRPGDVVVVMGGGRSYRIAELLLERLAAASLH